MHGPSSQKPHKILAPSSFRPLALTYYPAYKNTKNWSLMAFDSTDGSRSPSRTRSFSQQVSAIAARLGRGVAENGNDQDSVEKLACK